MFDEKTIERILASLDDAESKGNMCPVKGNDALTICTKLGYDLQEIGKILSDFSLAAQAHDDNVTKKKNEIRKKLEKALEEGIAADFMNDMSQLSDVTRDPVIEGVLNRYNEFKERIAKDGGLEMDIERHIVVICMALFSAMLSEFNHDKHYVSVMPFPAEYLHEDAETLRNHKDSKDTDEAMNKLLVSIMESIIRRV